MRCTTIAVCGVLLFNAFAGAATPRPVDFNRDVRPILSDNCFACHGPDAKSVKGDVRIDLRDSVIKPDKHGRAPIVPGDPDASKLIHRIGSDDPDEVMPPPESHKTLSAAQKLTLRRWIEQGAVYEKHWAYVPPRRTDDAAPLPQWIDRYLAAQLAPDSMQLSPPADRITLIRRLSFDLAGLPPIPEEVGRFVGDDSPGAYTKLVDRLLASPHFGERMAVWWLDLVRYADSVGYHGDQVQNIHPYRDYVIASFNANKSFDRFTVEQLAGDLLEHPAQEQLVATGYNRVLQTSHEGGIQLKEYRAIYQADRIRNASQVWMGATMGCCQCHDHKYDPYTTRDFYSMGAFFADIDDETHLNPAKAGPLSRNPTTREPEMHVLSEKQRQAIAEIGQKMQSIQHRLSALREAALAHQPQWERQVLAERENATPVEQAWIDDEQDTGGKSNGDWNFVKGPGALVHSGQTSRRQTAGGLVQHFFIEAKNTVKLAEGDRFYAWVYLDPKNPPKAIMLQFNDGSWDHRAVWGDDAIEYGRKPDSWRGYMRQGALPSPGQWTRLEVDPAAIGLKPGDVINGMAFTQFAGLAYWDDAGLISRAGPPLRIIEALAINPVDRDDKTRQLITDFYLTQVPEIATIDKQLHALRSQQDELREQGPLTMYTRALDQPRAVRVLSRGNWMDESGVIVEPAIPEFLGHLKTPGRRATRLDLARWLIAPAAKGGVGEMTARVQVNRFWKLLFGVGIARVLDDFGGQGEPPVYPELLDRLAVEFIDSGWDVKHLFRQIVMSRAYQQSSIASPPQLQHDPDNRRYARQSRWRLPAEMVRDNALAVSGLLVDDVIGGPPVKPYQPAGYYDHLNFPKRAYEVDQNDRQWRRGVYMHWQRQFLHPMLKAFDAPTREECTASRPVSNIPTQALVLLNDPTFVEAARALAVNILRQNGDDAARLNFVFRRVVSRAPDAQELAMLSKLLGAHHSQYDADPSAARAVISVGSSKPPADLDPVALVAWTSVCRAMLNLNETITRN